TNTCNSLTPSLLDLTSFDIQASVDAHTMRPSTQIRKAMNQSLPADASLFTSKENEVEKREKGKEKGREKEGEGGEEERMKEKEKEKEKEREKEREREKEK